MTTLKRIALAVSCTGFYLAGTAPEGRAAVYVVDRAAAATADSNPGSEEKPFKTVQRAADAAQAGRYDLRHGGPL